VSRAPPTLALCIATDDCVDTVVLNDDIVTDVAFV
jgi:hypothetical protein